MTTDHHLTLLERIEALEATLGGKLALDKLPLKALQDRLASDWDPPAAELLLKGSVSNSLLGTDSVDERAIGVARIEPLWAAIGTNTTTGGAAAEVLENGTELFDPRSGGTTVAYTLPEAGIIAVLAHCNLQNSGVGAEVIMTMTVNAAGAGQLFRADNPGGAGSGPAGAGFHVRSCAAGDVITATVQHFDGAIVRSIDWRMLIARLRLSS